MSPAPTRVIAEDELARIRRILARAGHTVDHPGDMSKIIAALCLTEQHFEQLQEAVENGPRRKIPAEAKRIRRERKRPGRLPFYQELLRPPGPPFGTGTRGP